MAVIQALGLAINGHDECFGILTICPDIGKPRLTLAKGARYHEALKKSRAKI